MASSDKLNIFSNKVLLYEYKEENDPFHYGITGTITLLKNPFNFLFLQTGGSLYAMNSSPVPTHIGNLDLTDDGFSLQSSLFSKVTETSAEIQYVKIQYFAIDRSSGQLKFRSMTVSTGVADNIYGLVPIK